MKAIRIVILLAFVIIKATTGSFYSSPYCNCAPVQPCPVLVPTACPCTPSCCSPTCCSPPPPPPCCSPCSRCCGGGCSTSSCSSSFSSVRIIGQQQQQPPQRLGYILPGFQPQPQLPPQYALMPFSNGVSASTLSPFSLITRLMSADGTAAQNSEDERPTTIKINKVTTEGGRTNPTTASLEVMDGEVTEKATVIAVTESSSTTTTKVNATSKTSSKAKQNSLDDLYDDTVSEPAATLAVADVSREAKTLVPFDIFQKRHHYFRQLKNRHLRQFSSPSVTNSQTKRKICNNFKLGKSMVGDVTISKRLVRKATEITFGGMKFDVLCATGDFSYSIYAEQYCEATRRNITCFAFI